MFRKYFLSLLLFFSIFCFSSVQLYAQEKEGEVIIISERVGEEIDKEEREKFGLFPDIIGFQSAVLLKLPDNTYFFEITHLDEQTGELKIERIKASEESIYNIRYQIDIKPWEVFNKIQAQKPGEKAKTVQKQETVIADDFREPGTAIFLELFGKPYASINMDFRINKLSRFSLGIMLWHEAEDEEEGKNEMRSFMPHIMYYIFRGRNNRLEMGGGFGVPPVWHKEVEDFPLAFLGVIGYRYQKKDGLLFRIGLTPSWYPGTAFIPFPGISFGYSL